MSVWAVAELKAKNFKPTTALSQTLFSVSKLIIKKQSKIRFGDLNAQTSKDTNTPLLLIHIVNGSIYYCRVCVKKSIPFFLISFLYSYFLTFYFFIFHFCINKIWNKKYRHCKFKNQHISCNILIYICIEDLPTKKHKIPSKVK